MAKKGNEGFLRTVIRRGKAKTPPFFKKLRKMGLIVTALGGALVAAPVALPAVIVTAAGYLVVAGSVLTAVSQVAVKEEEEPVRKETNNV